MDPVGDRDRWALVVTAGLLIAVVNAYYIAPASVLSLAMADMAIGPAAAGWIVGALFGAQVVVGVPGGIVLDRVDNRRAMGAGVAVLLVAFAWGYRAGEAGAYYPLIGSRALAAVGITLVWNGGATVVGRAFDAERQATAIGIYAAGPPAGFALGQFTGPMVADAFGWPAVLAAYGPPAVVAFGLFWVASRGIDVSGGDTPTPGVGDFRRVLTSRGVWHVSTMALLAFVLYSFVNSWMPTYLTDRLGFSLAASGVLVALFPAVGIAARSASGVVSDRVFDHRRRPVALLSFAVAGPAVAVMAAAETVGAVIATLALAGLAVQLGQGLFYSYVRELARPNTRATAISLLTSMATVGGLVGPTVAGALIEATGDYLAAFGFAVASAAAGVALAWVAPEPA